MLRLILAMISLYVTGAWAQPPGLTQFNGACPRSGCVDEQFSVHRPAACAEPNRILGSYSFSMVRKFADLSLAGGTSTLVTAGDGLAFTLTTAGLASNTQYTVWWVGFNPDNPCLAACDCSGAKLRLGAEDAVFYAAGATTDVLGNATFSGHTPYNVLPGGRDQAPFGGSAISPGAEIHFVVRRHGGVGKQ